MKYGEFLRKTIAVMLLLSGSFSAFSQVLHPEFGDGGHGTKTIGKNDKLYVDKVRAALKSNKGSLTSISNVPIGGG